MKTNTRTRWMICALLAASIIAAYLFLNPPQPPPSAPPGAAYYTGPMRSKSDPNAWITADGKRVPPPADAFPLPASLPKGGARSGKIPTSD